MVMDRRGSIRLTIAITVVAAIALGFALQQLVSESLPYFGYHRRQNTQVGVAGVFQQMPYRINAIIGVLNATPPDHRQAVIGALQLPELSFRLLDQPLPMMTNDDEPDAVLLHNRIIAALTVPRSVIVANRYRPANPQHPNEYDRVQRGVRIETTLFDGQWILFVSRLNPPAPGDPIASRFQRTSLATWLAMTIVLGVLLSLFVARRVAKPLSDLAIAVEQLGGQGDTAPIDANGPLEVQRAIEAFNRMQARLRRFNDDRTRMIAAMSHDLRSPLTRLRLRTELVDGHDQQSKMLAEIDMMGAMIDSMLAFARDDTKREPRSLVDLSALVEGICENAADVGDAVTYSGPRDVNILCRPAALRRAISNIVDNAIKYGNKAALVLSCEANVVRIVIDDEGPGIPQSERDRVFEPFYRIENARSPDQAGVGLGLSVARSIILEHGGEISLGSSAGGGLSVKLEFPIGAGVKWSDGQVG
jgi:signal transduction histidine kinase